MNRNKSWLNQLIEKKERWNDNSTRWIDRFFATMPLTAQLYGEDYFPTLRLILFKMDGK